MLPVQDSQPKMRRLWAGTSWLLQMGLSAEGPTVPVAIRERMRRLKRAQVALLFPSDCRPSAERAS